jgi:arginyl-tRNA synthetase
MPEDSDKKEIIAEIITNFLKDKKIKLSKEEIIKKIETPPNPELGDYAFPCFFLSSKLKQDPNKIALEIRVTIKNSKEFSDIKTQGPYLNFFVNREDFSLKLIKEIKTKGNSFGSTNIGKGKRVLIEHTSINPNASPHVGRARNAIIGDSIVKILKFEGFNPEVHYFVNDVSKQIAMLVLAGAENLKFESMLKKYVEIAAKVKKSKKLEAQVFDLLYKFEHQDASVSEKFKRITKTSVEGQKKILAQIGINYDFFDYESSYLNQAKQVLDNLKKTKKLFKDKDGRMVLDLKGTSIEGQMKSPVLVLTRSDGTGLYPLRDIAYTIDKISKSDFNIIVLGEDQKLYFQQITEALKLLGYTAPKIIHYSFILLNEKGKSKKMSTRSGDVVLLEDFLKKAIKKAEKKSNKKTNGEKVGIGAVKYSIIRNSPNKIINFNLDEALNFEGDTGPYLLYSYARASSILKKSNKKANPDSNSIDKKEIELIKKMSEFENVVRNSYDNLNPSNLANYSYQLAQVFNEFYHECPVLKSEKESFRLSLVEAFRQVLKNSLYLLGIDVLEKM